MSSQYDSIRSQIDQLDPSEKVHLLSDLFEILASEAIKEREAKWAAVAKRRLSDLDNGLETSEDWESVRRRLTR